MSSDLAKASQTIAADLAGYRKMIPAFLAENQWQREAKRLLAAVDGL